MRKSVCLNLVVRNNESPAPIGYEHFDVVWTGAFRKSKNFLFTIASSSLSSSSSILWGDFEDEHEDEHEDDLKATPVFNHTYFSRNRKSALNFPPSPV
jgi:hypothetical protein